MPPIKTAIPFSLLVAACLTVGCDAPPPEPKDLGRIVYNPQEVPGAEQPYTMPGYLKDLLEKPQEGRPPEK